MDMLREVLTSILEIGGVVVVIAGAVMWLRTAFSARSTARSFMALVFTIVFFIVVLLRNGDYDEKTIRWLSVVYGSILAFYILARMVEHREEIKAGEEQEDKVELETSKSVLLDELQSDPSIDAHGLSIRLKPRGLLRRKKAIEISGTVSSEEVKEKVTNIAEKYAGNLYVIINDLIVQ